MAGGEGAGEVDDGELIAEVCGDFVPGTGRRKTWATEAAPPGTGWVESGAA